MNSTLRLYDSFLYDSFRGVHDFSGGTVRMALLSDSYTPCAVFGTRDGLVTYAVGDVVYSGTYHCFFVAAVGGMTSLGAPAFDVTPGARTTDGAVVWVSAGLAPPSAHTSFSDVSATEITSSGYTAGGETALVTVAVRGGATNLECPAVKWTESAIAAKYAVIYRVGTINGVVNPLIAYILLDSAGGLATSSSGTFLVSFGGSSLLTVGGWGA